VHVNRGLLFWGIGFITAGLVVLAIQLGYLDRSALADAWRLWPLILVAIGIAIIASRTQLALVGTIVAAIVLGGAAGTAIAVGPGFGSNCGGNPPSSLQDHSGTFQATATLDWRLDCGSLDVSMTDGSTWRASVGTTGDRQPSVDGTPDHLNLRSNRSAGAFFFDSGRERWVVALPTATTYDAKIHANATSMTVDLRASRFSALGLQPNAADLTLNAAGASIEGLDVEMNAGSMAITADAQTALSGTIQMNAGSVDLCAPADAGLQITSSGTAFGTNLDESNLTRNGDTWRSQGYTSAQHKITLTVHGNAGSFNLNPEEGCE
jgi:hypothetical protein